LLGKLLFEALNWEKNVMVALGLLVYWIWI